MPVNRRSGSRGTSRGKSVNSSVRRREPRDHYLADLEEEESYVEEREPRRRGKSGGNPAAAIIVSVLVTLAVIVGIMVMKKRDMWDSKLRTARQTVESSEDINSMMVAIQYLIDVDDTRGMRMAGRHFIERAKTLKDKDLEAWRSNIGEKLLKWSEVKDQELRNDILPYTKANVTAVWSGNKAEYDAVIASLRDAGRMIESQCNLQWFKDNITTKMDLTTYRPPNPNMKNGKTPTYDEMQLLLKQALHFDWTKVHAYHKGEMYINNQNPTIRMKFQIQDETYMIVIWADLLMEKQGDQWVVKHGAILNDDPSDEKK